MSDRCDSDVFKNGTPLLAADTGPVGGAKIFEVWVQEVARKSGQRVDWHYSGGIAQVLVLGDLAAARTAAESIPLPEQMAILQWFGDDSAGLYRAGVTDAPENAVATFLDPVSCEQVYMVDGTSE